MARVDSTGARHVSGEHASISLMSDACLITWLDIRFLFASASSGASLRPRYDFLVGFCVLAAAWLDKSDVDDDGFRCNSRSATMRSAGASRTYDGTLSELSRNSSRCDLEPQRV